MVKWNVGDYFYSPHIPESATKADVWQPGAWPVVGKVIETVQSSVRAQLIVGARDKYEGPYWFPVSLIKPITNEAVLPIIAAHALTGEVPEALLKDFDHA